MHTEDEVTVKLRGPRYHPFKYHWWARSDLGGSEVIELGEPDCFGMIQKFKPISARYPSNRYCWYLVMPRGGKEVARGWATKHHEAKRQVERAIDELWQ